MVRSSGFMAEEVIAIECPICLTARQDIVVTRCQHKFCKSCIVKQLTESPVDVFYFPSPPPSCAICRQTISAYEITYLDTGKPLIEKPASIFGGVYVQCGTEGLASYHFSEEESYISYSAAPDSWRLKDGSAPPERKPFLHSTYVPAIRTFRAVVDWSSMNFGGDAQWIYRIVFSEDFMKIETGEVISYGPNGQKRRWHVFEQDLAYVRMIKHDLT